MNKPGATNFKRFYSLLCIFTVISVFSFRIDAIAQRFSIDGHYWSDDTSIPNQARLKPRIQTKSARILSLEFNSFSKQVAMIKKADPGFLEQQGTVISLPLPDGTFERYAVATSSIMEDELARKFPQIKTYAGQGIEDPLASIRFDVTPQGFHAIIFKRDQVIYIDPAYADNTSKYIAYYKSDFVRQGPVFSENPVIESIKGKNAPNKKKAVNRALSARSSGSELRTYRLAVAATGQYTNFHGGNVTNALSAIATSINRVNGIYEREVAIRMILVEDNDEIIYTNPATDPYTNDESILLKDENQTNLDNVIGSSNYDIGHVFSTAFGGSARVGGVCDDNTKAQGTTGLANPVGDPFDVDFVAHEIGHQFGAEHTFNGTTGNCNDINRSALTSYEPGSGTTIMGYAGICAPQNIQNNSNDYFHTASYDQIVEFITNGTGNNCPSTSSTGNTPPVVEAGDDYFIPVNTPFTLTGSATDDDGDPLTYCWEQYDLGPAGPPNDPNTTGPLFRSFSPVSSPSRTFPQLSDILNNTSTLGEILPAITRTMEFRLTARDNRSGGGGVDYDNMTINVVDLAGKFEITSLNQDGVVEAGIPEDISWEVAETNLSPINTQLVNIRLSTDGGLTFPVMLAENVDNDGLETIIFPDNATDQARIKIEAVDNIYFDINDQDFSIEVPDTPGFVVVVDPISSETCIPSEAIFTIDVISVLGFNEPVDLTINNLPAGVEATFGNDPVIPGNSTTLTITNTAGATPDDYTIELASSSGTINQQNDINLRILGNPPTPELFSPTNGAVDLPLVPFLSWVDDLQIDKYTFELALDADFNNIVDSVYDLSDAFYKESEQLESNVTYYWRVKGVNDCGEGEYSETFSFTTLLINYFTFESTDVPKTIDDGDPNTVVSTIEIEIVDDIIISDLNVINLKGEHSFISDLKFTLRSPVGTEVVLFSDICFNEQNFALSLDDESVNTSFLCPPTDGESYQPTGSLSDFNGQNARGTWTLIIEDNAMADGGILNSWALEIGTEESRPKPPANLQASPTSVDAITVGWEDNSNNEDNFILERSAIDNSNFEEIVNLSANSQSFDDTGLMSETIYIYRIKAVNQFGASAYSQEAKTATLPNAPGNLAANVVSVSQIDLTWSDLSSIEQSYVIERSVDDNQNFVVVNTIDANSQSHSQTGLEEGTTYYFRIYAQNQYGRSSFSEEVNATTLVLGLEDEIADNISVFPNPTESELIIKVENEGLFISGVRLTDIRGRQVKYLFENDIKMQKDALTLVIDTSAKGLYLLEIITDKGKVIKRIIKK